MTMELPPSLFEEVEHVFNDNLVLSERLASLELALDTMDWRNLTWQADREFSREGLRIIAEMARIFYLKNPLIKRGVQVQALYVWGQGFDVRAYQEEIQEVIQDFLKDRENRKEFTSDGTRTQKEVELQIEGNLFFVLFVDEITGQVRVRSIPCEEVSQIITDPNDVKTQWYYKRLWTQEEMEDIQGILTRKQYEAYYPDWHYNPVSKPSTIGGVEVRWKSPIYHIKVNCFSNWRFGVSEMYAAMDWARAYKEFLEDWASIVRAYRKFAFQLTTPGGAKSIQASKQKLNTTVGNETTPRFSETNPPPIPGSMFISDPSVNLSPIRTSGATVAAEDGRRLLLMVAAGTGLPETFFGDVSVGTLATATSLDRPTELAMRARQSLWEEIHRDIFDYVLFWAVKAPQGPLKGKGTVTTRILQNGRYEEDIEWPEGYNHEYHIDFPKIVVHDPSGEVRAIVSAATLDGRPLAGTLDIISLTRILLVALGEDNPEEIMDRMFPNGEIPDWVQQRIDNPQQGNGATIDKGNGNEPKPKPKTQPSD